VRAARGDVFEQNSEGKETSVNGEEGQELPTSESQRIAFGGRWVPESFVPALAKLADANRRIVRKRSFRKRLQGELERFGRPTPLLTADRLSARVGGAKILLKREDRLETGSRHLTVALGQALLAEMQGSKRLLGASATGAGAVAIATAAARFGLSATIFGGVEDLRLREHAFSRAETLGAEIVPVDLGAGRVSEALQVAFCEWVRDFADSRLVLTSAVGPDPFPTLVGELEGFLGRELSNQLRKRRGKNIPDLVVAPISGGTPVGAFSSWVDRPEVRLIGTSPAADDAPIDCEEATVLHGARTLLLPVPDRADDPELDRPQRYRALSPTVATWLRSGRVGAALVSDAAARGACRDLAQTEGLLVSIQSGEVLAEACERASRLSDRDLVVAVMSGHGNDDIGELSAPLPPPLEPIGPVLDYPALPEEEG